MTAQEFLDLKNSSSGKSCVQSGRLHDEKNLTPSHLLLPSVGSRCFNHR